MATMRPNFQLTKSTNKPQESMHEAGEQNTWPTMW